MIDIENELFSILSTVIIESYPDIFMSGEYVMSPPSFPALSFVEISNEVYRKSQSTDEFENHDIIVYEANVYSNKTRGKKSECKAIISLLDSKLLSLGFTRTMLTPVQNMADPSIYRITGRWRAIVSKDRTIYRR